MPFVKTEHARKVPVHSATIKENNYKRVPVNVNESGHISRTGNSLACVRRRVCVHMRPLEMSKLQYECRRRRSSTWDVVLAVRQVNPREHVTQP